MTLVPVRPRRGVYFSLLGLYFAALAGLGWMWLTTVRPASEPKPTELRLVMPAPAEPEGSGSTTRP